MADDWEDWEAEDFVPPPPPVATPAPKAGDDYETAGQALLAKMNQVDESKFADEDAEEDEPEEEPVQKVRRTPVCCYDARAGDGACSRSDADTRVGLQSQPRKERRSDKWAGKGASADVALDDPVAEKLRRQRCVAGFAARPYWALRATAAMHPPPLHGAVHRCSLITCANVVAMWHTWRCAVGWA